MSNVLPDIGLSGVFELRTPFDTKVPNKTKLICKAIRKISDYLASSEDVKELCYLNNGLTEEDYENDLISDTEIVSLQSGEGQWLYVPAGYIVSYPLTNGVPYRSLVIGVNLPQIPVDQDLSDMNTDIANVVKDHIGLLPIISSVETSTIIYVATDKHESNIALRNLEKNNKSYRTRYIEANLTIDALNNKIQELETYIKDNLP